LLTEHKNYGKVKFLQISKASLNRSIFVIPVIFQGCEDNLVSEGELQPEDQVKPPLKSADNSLNLSDTLKSNLGRLMNSLKAAAPEHRFKLIKQFETKYNIELASVSPAAYTTASSPTAQELAAVEVVGPQSMNMYANTHPKTEVKEWTVVKNRAGWWFVKAYDQLHYGYTIHSVQHMGSQMIGITGGVVSWSETYSRVLLDYLVGAYAFVEVTGDLQNYIIGHTEIRNYIHYRASAGS